MEIKWLFIALAVMAVAFSADNMVSKYSAAQVEIAKTQQSKCTADMRKDAKNGQ